MTAVTFSASVGGDDSVISDDASPTTGLKNGGHRTRFVNALVQLVAIAGYTKTQATNAAASATSAVNAPGTSATSTTSMTVSVASKAFTLAQTGKLFSVGQTVVIARTSNPGGQQMSGIITAFTSGTGAITVNVTTVVGSVTATDWTISLSAVGGVQTSRSLGVSGLVTGGGDLSADRTFTVTAAAASDVRTGTDTSKALTAAALVQSAAEQTLTDAATVTWDSNSGYNAKVTPTANRTLAAITNPKEGVTYVLRVIQDGTGTRTITWNACYDFGLVGPPTLSTAAGKIDLIFMYCYDAATPKFRCSYSKSA